MMRKIKKSAVLCVIMSCVFILTSCKSSSKPEEDTVVSFSENIVASAENVENTTENTESVSEEADAEKAEDNKENKEEKETVAIKDLPILSDSVMATIGARAGCAITGSEVDDEKVWEILTTHFNAVTLGNELKPDCLFGYSNGTCPGKEVILFNGEEFEAPKMDFSRANRILNKILKWNEENPERQIKVRGHVLVWHSQTPEWFFHEDYDKSKPYVDIATMNKRLEWYICNVLTYYTGEDSKYKDLFYGWDVVNEAVSDGGGYRTDNENPSESKNQDTHGSNSSWWHIYGSNEYIINAFKFANKYAPESLELYYNDYNECNAVKQKTIKELLTEIKENEGAPGEGTRISAMGMQAHYGIDSSNPESTSVASAIKNYCAIVGNVQLTEIDVKISSAYDQTEDGIAEMNETLRKRYNLLYFAIKSAIVDEGVNVTGITFWGTVDHYSWLQSQSNVGGGNTTKIKQMPLLFDKDYQAKPCFYVFAK